MGVGGFDGQEFVPQSRVRGGATDYSSFSLPFTLPFSEMLLTILRLFLHILPVFANFIYLHRLSLNWLRHIDRQNGRHHGNPYFLF